MAGFDVPVAPMQPNNYLSNFSQGTDRASLQPLADVPKLSEKVVEPKWKENDSAGLALGDVAKLETSGLGLANSIIKQNIDTTLTDGINKIRDSFGVAAADNIESGVASAVGRGGADGVSLTDSTGQPPAVLQKLGTQVDGLTEAYKQGQLSNSAYYAKMDAYVRQVKQQFPGYSDEVDQITSSKLGVTPANALRSALQDDVAKLQTKVQAQNDKWTTYEHTNAQYIYTQWPNYDQLKAQGQAPGKADVEAAVGTMQARDYSYTSGMAKLAVVKASNAAVADQGSDLVIQKAGDIAAHLTVGVTNSLGIKTPADFNKLLDDVRNGKRAPLTPDEKQAATGVFATMEQQYGLQFDKFINTPLNKNTTETLASKIGDPSKIAAMRTQGMQPITDQKAGLLDDKYGILAQSNNWNNASIQAGEGDFIRRAPVAVAAAAGRKFYGDQGVMMLQLQSPALNSAMLEGFRQWNQGKIAQGTGSLRETFDTYKTEGMNDGTLNKAAISDTVNTILHAKDVEDPTAGQKAVQHAFGPGNRTLLEAFNDKNQIDVFTQLVSPTMVHAIKKMDGNSQKTFTTWADDGFTSVFEAQSADANQAAVNYASRSNMTLKYDPNAQQFQFVGGRNFGMSGSTPKLMLDTANSKLAGLNIAITNMKEVFKLEGKDPTEALYNILPAAGVQPGTPLYKAIQEEYIKANPPTDRAGNRY